MNEIERHTLLEIGEDPDSPDVYVDTADGLAPIRASLGEAIQEIVMLTGSVSREYHLPLIQKRSFYRLQWVGGGMGWITDTWVVGVDRRLAQTSFAALNDYDPRWLLSTGVPTSYLQVGLNIIGVHPRPSTTGDILSIKAVVIPAEYTHDKDRVQLKKNFRLAAVQYAVAEYWAGRGDARSAASAFQNYRDLLGIRKKDQRYPEHAPRADQNKEPWPGAESPAPARQ